MDDTTTATIDSAGRIVIPKGIRERVGLYPGASVVIRLDDHGVYLKPGARTPELVKRGRLLVVVSSEESPTVDGDTVTALREEIASERVDGHPAAAET